MTAIISIFILGTAVGSFINVLESRLYKGENFLTLPSHCDHCKKRLKWSDMIPVISWILYGGKSRCCRKRLSWQYPVVELITGFAFVAISAFGLMRHNNWFYYIFYDVIFVLCFTILLQDLKYQAIHEKLLWVLMGVTLLFIFVGEALTTFSIGWVADPPLRFINIFVGFLSALPFFFLYKLSREKWLGEGDVWLAAWMGLFLGFPRVFWATYVGLIIGGLISLIIVLLKLKKMRDTISLGPFLLIGTLVSLFIK